MFATLVGANTSREIGQLFDRLCAVATLRGFVEPDTTLPVRPDQIPLNGWSLELRGPRHLRADFFLAVTAPKVPSMSPIPVSKTVDGPMFAVVVMDDHCVVWSEYGRDVRGAREDSEVVELFESFLSRTERRAEPTLPHATNSLASSYAGSRDPVPGLAPSLPHSAPDPEVRPYRERLAATELLNPTKKLQGRALRGAGAAKRKETVKIGDSWTPTIEDGFIGRRWRAILDEQLREMRNEDEVAGLSAFVPLVPGCFRRGTRFGGEGGGIDEIQHKVELKRSFLLASAPVTQAEYQAVMGTNPSRFQGAARPVEQLSWLDAIAFCNALSRAEGLEEAYLVDGSDVRWKDPDCPGYRLPTEAEWEYACRAGSFGARYGKLNEIAWHAGNSDGQTHPVRQKRPNGWGLYDMLGNVWEWCWDRYGPYPVGRVIDPSGPASGSARVSRGGSWRGDARCARAARRNYENPIARRGGHGFRLALTLPQAAGPPP